MLLELPVPAPEVDVTEAHYLKSRYRTPEPLRERLRFEQFADDVVETHACEASLAARHVHAQDDDIDPLQEKRLLDLVVEIASSRSTAPIGARIGDEPEGASVSGDGVNAAPSPVMLLKSDKVSECPVEAIAVGA